MKKIAYYIFLMIIIVIFLPLLIVKSCSFKAEGPELKGANTSKIKVFISSDNKTEEMNLEEYVKGVVAAEMPINFEIEALKAQAIAARTYTYSRKKKYFSSQQEIHNEADVCTDSTHCQAWISKEKAFNNWGEKASKNWQKIEKAVNTTSKLIIMYDNKVINPVFHSNSGGKTENVEDVWECSAVPYLKSVESEGEETSEKQYKSNVILKNKEFIAKLKAKYPSIKLNENDVIKDINDIHRSEGGKIKTTVIGGIEVKGTDLRSIFSLKSSNISFERADDKSINLITLGYGHGVGMSQWGANYLATRGENYKNIIKHYYSGVQLEKIKD